MSAAYSVGEKIQIEWNGSWWPGEVLALLSDGTVAVHYDGWDSSSDETVPTSRIRRSADGPPPAPPAPPPGPVAAAGLEGYLLGEPVTDKTRLAPGGKVLVDWNGSWWAGEVISANADGSVRIHYSGWTGDFDETVARARLQLPTETRKVVTIHFDRTWSISGTLVRSLPEGYIISRKEDGKLCLINRQSVAFVDLGA
jgi:hypothetical protein